jgi:hypothetical protein
VLLEQAGELWTLKLQMWMKIRQQHMQSADAGRIAKGKFFYLQKCRLHVKNNARYKGAW